MNTDETTCYYCGDPLADSLQTPKRRIENGVWHKLHAACAQNWDNEGRRS